MGAWECRSGFCFQTLSNSGGVQILPVFKRISLPWNKERIEYLLKSIPWVGLPYDRHLPHLLGILLFYQAVRLALHGIRHFKSCIEYLQKWIKDFEDSKLKSKMPSKCGGCLSYGNPTHERPRECMYREILRSTRLDTRACLKVSNKRASRAENHYINPYFMLHNTLISKSRKTKR